MSDIRVIKIPANEAMSRILGQHYAKRKCPITHAFGAYRGGGLVGVVTYGTPFSAPLRSGICGPDYALDVLELNRLCCENTKNMASILVGQSLRLLPKTSIVVSYADTSQGHVGYVYQATNFLYTGLSAKRTDWKIKGQEHLYGGTVADQSYGQENRADWMRAKYGDDFFLEERPRKHRYVFFCGNKNRKRICLAALKYPIEPYPKGDSRKYNIPNAALSQRILFND